MDDQLLRSLWDVQGPGEEGIDLFWVEHGGKRVIVGRLKLESTLYSAKAFSRGIIDKPRLGPVRLLNDEMTLQRTGTVLIARRDRTMTMRPFRIGIPSSSFGYYWWHPAEQALSVRTRTASSKPTPQQISQASVSRPRCEVAPPPTSC